MIRYTPIVLAGLWRKPLRTILTGAAIAAAFLLFGLLNGFKAGFDSLVDDFSDVRLRVHNRTSSWNGLPMAHVELLKAIEGVKYVSYAEGLSAYYQEPSEGVVASGIDADNLTKVFYELRLDPVHLDAFRRSRTAALVGRDLAAEYGWHIGDRIPLISRKWTNVDGSNTWTFDIVGIWDIDGPLPSNEFYFHYPYLDEARDEDRGTVWGYWVIVQDPEQAALVAKRIDEAMLNSATPTRTLAEKEWANNQLRQLGDVEFFVNAIVGAVFFSILAVTGSTMMQSMRERIPEFAVLKSFGYRSDIVTLIAFFEALVISVGGSAVGLGLAAFGLSPLLALLGSAVSIPIPPDIFVAAVFIAITLAVVSTVAPALHVHRASVDSLAGR